MKTWRAIYKILWLLQALRLADVVKAREHGYSWYKYLSTELYEHQKKKHEILEYHTIERAMWLEGSRRKFKRGLPSEPVEDQGSHSPKELVKLKVTKVWGFGIYALNALEDDLADKKTRKSQFYDDLAKFGKIMWLEYPSDGFGDEH